MQLRFLLLITLICYRVSCFCIYNMSKDADFNIHQLSHHTSSNIFSRFKREALKRGETACCPYNESDCVSDMRRETVLMLSIQRVIKGREYPNFIITVPGGGWVELAGTDHRHATINVFNADGTPFKFEYSSGTDGFAYT